MADRVIMPRALDNDGNIAPGATAYFYQTGTTTPLAVYADSGAVTALGVTLEANASGVFPPVYTTAALRLDIKDSEGVSLSGFPSDNWHITPSNGLGAAQITFPPIDGNEADNVEDAIANNTAFNNTFGAFGKVLATTATPLAARDAMSLSGLATVEILDEDDFAADSATRPPSQQSVGARITTRVREIMGITGTAPAFAVRAYVVFGPVGGIASSGNVASVTRNAAGKFTVNFTTALPSANYAVVGMTASNTDTNITGSVTLATDSGGAVVNKTATACQIFTGQANTAALGDNFLTSVIFVG